MCIVLHCRVLFLLVYFPFVHLLVYPFVYLYSDVMLVWSLQSQYEELAINYPSILFQANLLSCFSTAVGLVHEPPLPNGVVNLQQPKFGAQCGAPVRWRGSQTHRCDTQLLGDIASYHTLRRKHQLAHVSQLAADAESCMKNDFFQQKNTSECMTFTVWPTGKHWTVCGPITHTSSAEGLCPVTNGECCDQYSHNPLHSQGEHGDKEEPHNEEGSSTIIPEQTDSLSREVVPGPTCEDEDCTVNLVIVPGALNICGAMGTYDSCGILEQQLDLYRSEQSFHFSLPWSPLQIGAGACLLSLTFTVDDYLTRF